MPECSVFDRLYKTPTVSWSQKHSTSSSAGSAKPSTSRDSKPSVLNNKHNKATLKEPSPSLVVRSSDAPVFSSSMIRLTWTNHYQKEPRTIQPLLPKIPSTAHKFWQALQDYENAPEETSAAAAALVVAKALIGALFDRDFSTSKAHRWDHDGVTVCEQKQKIMEEGIMVHQYRVECSATYDWKDIYAVASSKATIMFFSNRQEIRVDDYSYYVAG